MSRQKDMTGLRFGTWEVQHEVGLDRHGHMKWLLKCDCGETHIARGTTLRSGFVKSCSCSKDLTENTPRKGVGMSAFEVSLRSVMAGIKNQAKKRGYSFELSRSELKQLVFQECFYCGAPPSNYRRMRDGKTFLWQGIDRVNNELGYTLENSVPCCKRCNVAKNNSSLTEFTQMIRKIYTHLQLDK